MSSALQVFLVDWDDFMSQALYLAGPELELYQVTDYCDEPCFPYSSGCLSFLECSDQSKRLWPAEQQEQFEQIFHTLFWCEAGAQVARELPDPVIDAFEGIAIRTALSPTRVNQLAVIARKFNFDEIATVFKPCEWLFNSFEFYRQYGQFWLDILCEAANLERGLLIVEWC